MFGFSAIVVGLPVLFLKTCTFETMFGGQILSCKHGLKHPINVLFLENSILKNSI